MLMTFDPGGELFLYSLLATPFIDSNQRLNVDS